MKKILLTVLFFGLVAAGVSGCAKKELPSQGESPLVVEIPAHETVMEVGGKTDAATGAALETPVKIADMGVTATDPEAQAVPEKILKIVDMGFTTTDPAIPSALVQAAGPDEKTVAGNVTSAVQSSAQAVIREGATIAGGVAASTQSSTQDAVRAGSAVVGGVTTAAVSSSQASASNEDATAEENEMEPATLPAAL